MERWERCGGGGVGGEGGGGGGFGHGLEACNNKNFLSTSEWSSGGCGAVGGLGTHIGACNKNFLPTSEWSGGGGGRWGRRGGLGTHWRLSIYQ